MSDKNRLTTCYVQHAALLQLRYGPEAAFAWTKVIYPNAHNVDTNSVKQSWCLNLYAHPISDY